MSEFDPNKLHITFMEGVTPSHPVALRHYTLTHSDKTAELFLDIGLHYSLSKISPMRDEVRAVWRPKGEHYWFCGFCYVGGDGEEGERLAALRYRIFVKELPLALKAIGYGDQTLFQVHPTLLEEPILISFRSRWSAYNRIEYWGTMKMYI